MVATLLVILRAAVAAADEGVSARLTYAAPNPGCPEQDSFRDQIVARLGYDPFASSAAKMLVRVEIRKRAGKLEGRAELVEDDAPRGVRVLTAELDKCEPLATALATTVAIALDPARALGSSQPSTEAPPPPAPTPPETIVVVHDVEHVPSAPEAPPPQQREPLALGLIATGAVAGSAAMAPGPTIGPELGVEARVRRYSLEILGRVDPVIGTATAASGDRLEATVVSGGIAPCAHVGSFAACALARVGSFQSRAPDAIVPRFASSIFASLGVRAAYVVPLGSSIGLRGALDVAFPLVRQSLELDNASVWTAPPVFVGLSIGVVARLL